ncbi:hypothetical protein A3C37_03915 [Candidatus Peribacteria bacterium RIFCSPHIGHO2_02_FULL_53_20]|nr:MAG: hypothetical protein A3C37_03915 [Candidatus Peribacteria bacterium RIFCSPHIGHO2_02_FULL_53_20]OGJ66095.1 MAG: hypothetical protein A3B61_04280 [Candidatus Peribacteria bacterium RIFCSPLOWO2_01_FULL_53_10]OGJ69963.1 MAG: hypothetical protein A3G69_02695 [Candidatus Peribacteria bacterium RIFCSPLOWO2_12_FULL_53_10]
MLRALLSILLLGMVTPPMSGSPLAAAVPSIDIAPPAIQMELAVRLSASGVVVIDAQSGQRVFGRQYDIPRPMASLTKLMTALIIVENHQLSEVVRVPQGIDPMQSTVRLPAGEQFTVGDLLSAMLIASSNDAAATLALFHSGSIDVFAEEMNTRAAVLGLHATLFENPVGLDDPSQYSTPQDLAWLTMAALRQPAIARRLGMRGAIIVSLQGSTVNLSHTNALMHTARKEADEKSPVVLAGKTGTTNGAGQCLMSIVGEGDRRYIVVLLDSLQRYRDMNAILAAFARTSIPPESLSLRALPR